MLSFDMTILDRLATLASWPESVPEARYGGDSLSVSIAALADSDREPLTRFYAALLRLVAEYPLHRDEDVKLSVLRSWIEEHRWQSLRRDIAAIGPDTYAERGSDPTLRKVVHDIRGGPMTSLAIDLGLIRANRLSDVDVDRVFLLSRDVCKIVRNGFPDIDTERYEADREIKAHDVALLVEKWSLMRGENAVEVECNFDGAIAESCIEFAALDRVLYNVMNNAMREAADGREPVKLILQEEPAERPRHLRFVVTNPVLPQQSNRLTHRFGSDLTPLFTSDFSTTGSGIGLQVVGEMVSRAYDRVPERALSAGHLGAFLDNNIFALWFHWPVVDTNVEGD